MTTKKTLILLIILIVAALIFGFARYYPPAASGGSGAASAPASDAAAVTNVVTEFGTKMQDVSLLAPAADVKTAMDQNYGPYVEPGLLASWESNPQNAPGRETSSPWPDHIEIAAVTPEADGTYEVQGTVIELTSQEVETGGVAAQYPATFTLENDGGTWLISSYTQGAVTQ